jgi:F0F1-type ATP synthase membrane subunit a
MELLTDPVALGLFGKIVGGIVIFFIAIGFVPGLLIGWFVGKAS